MAQESLWKEEKNLIRENPWKISYSSPTFANQPRKDSMIFMERQKSYVSFSYSSPTFANAPLRFSDFEHLHFAFQIEWYSGPSIGFSLFSQWVICFSNRLLSIQSWKLQVFKQILQFSIKFSLNYKPIKWCRPSIKFLLFPNGFYAFCFQIISVFLIESNGVTLQSDPPFSDWIVHDFNDQISTFPNLIVRVSIIKHVIF